MSYLLEFPSYKFPLPEGILKGPFVIFGIKGINVSANLPARIPLKAVLHFVPRLSHFVLPKPETLAPSLADGAQPAQGSQPVNESQYTDFVTVDIHLDIGVASLQHIIFKIMQVSGFHVPKNLFSLSASIITSVSIHKTWLLFELPPAGLDALYIHLQALLRTGPPVTMAELEAMWDNFPTSHIVHQLAAVNFVEAHLQLAYTRQGFREIRDWFVGEPSRREIFSKTEARYPEFGKMQFPPPSVIANWGCKSCVDCNHAESSRKAGHQKQKQKRQEVDLREEMAQGRAKRKARRASRRGSMGSLGPETFSTEVPALQLEAALGELLLERGEGEVEEKEKE